ncbi:hypothetical protein [Paenibacillus glucanolyticus]|uniref:hypothetical protein n=1 Tax=Paenibacillus glucanolyticus TaxID=59843 RepID=UPI00096F69D6|nr:hypothetical protein [Paenibacillus glucanolyticus]OMF63653.1 hypothetical protein BK142_32510 [Paenibacillus glucanolyticus]
MELEIHGIKFNVTTLEQGEFKTLKVLPCPEDEELFRQSVSVIDIQSLQILWSKHYYGINHRSNMFNVLFNTFKETLDNVEDLNGYFTLQVLYTDMVLRFGTILEEFAGMCSALREHSINRTNIAQYFLSYSDPMGFYNSMSAGALRSIKQMFRLPQSIGNLNRIFRDLTDVERDVLWNAVNKSTQMIQEIFNDIAQAITRNQGDSVTYYDMYNKLKHGFAPIYPFVTPVELTFENIPKDMDNSLTIKHFLMENVSLMHNKLPGQRTNISQDQQQENNITITMDNVSIENAENMVRIVESITYLYKHLVKTYLSYSQGSKKFSLLTRKEMLTPEEENTIINVIDNQERYLI